MTLCAPIMRRSVGYTCAKIRGQRLMLQNALYYSFDVSSRRLP